MPRFRSLSSNDLFLTELSRERFKRTRSVMDDGISKGVAPGIAAGVWAADDPDRIIGVAVGRRSVIPSPLDLEVGTPFDLASLTKVMATAQLAAQFVDRGWLAWDTPLRSILPGYPSRAIRIRHLLSHTAGLPAWEPLWERMRARFHPGPLEELPVELRQEAMRELVLAVKPVEKPELHAVYSDISFLLLGFALEEIAQMPLDQAVEKFVWKPMGLDGAHFHRVMKSAEGDRRENYAATEDSEWRGGVLQGQVHDDNCWAMGGYAGHAGAFGFKGENTT